MLAKVRKANLLVPLLMLLTVVTAEAAVPGAPTSLAVYSTTSEELEARWSSSDYAATTSFKVQWKSGDQEYDSSRQTSINLTTSRVRAYWKESIRRYKHAITGLTNGTEYTVRVIATNTEGDSEPSSETAGTPQSTPGQVHLFIENEVVKISEGSYPWLRDTWDHITDQNVNVLFLQGGGGGAGTQCSPDRPMQDNLRKCDATLLTMGRTTPNMIRVITHELAHIYTLANSVTTSPGSLGIAHLYFEKMNLTEPLCAPAELYADILMMLVHGGRSLIESVYWAQCSSTSDSLAEEALGVVGSAVAGETPSWFGTTYNNADNEPDLERLWADVKAVSSVKRRAVIAFQLRDEFGGYCDNQKATDSAFGSGVTRNPWQDGGCVPEAPRDVVVSSIGGGKLTVSWVAPGGDGGSPIEGYKVQWKSGSEEYASSRQAVVTGLSNLSHTITGLTTDTEYTLQVLAYNHNGDGTPSAEKSATATASDMAAPELLRATVDGATLVLAYNEALDEASEPPASAFQGRVGGAARGIIGVSVSGNAVTLTLASAAAVGAAVTVTYAVPTGSSAAPIQDEAGNDASGLTGREVRNDTTAVAITSDPGSDRTYILRNGFGRQDAIEATVTFSEAVTVTGSPVLTLQVGSAMKQAEYQGGSGTAVLTFRYEVDEGDEDTDGVSVPAGDIRSGGTIKYLSSNDLAPARVALAAQSGHKVDGVRPLLISVSAVPNGSVLTLTWDKALDENSVPVVKPLNRSGFTLWDIQAAEDRSDEISGISISGKVVTLTLSSVVTSSDQLRVTYGVPFSTYPPLLDTSGNYAGVWQVVVMIEQDTTAPTVSSMAITSNSGTNRTYAAGDEIRVTVTFSETVEVTGTPQLTLELGGGRRTATYGGGSGTAALLFAYEVADGDSDTDGVGVEADSLSGGTIRDLAGNDAVLDHDGLAANASHKVDGVRPRLAATGGAVVNGTTLTLTYDEALDGGSRPVSGDFTVSGGDWVRAVTGVRVNGSAVELTLDVGAEHGEIGILASYTPGTNPIRDVPGNEAVALSRESVTNETPDTTPPEVESLTITSNPGSDQTYAVGDEIEVTVTFSETVKVTGTPRLRLRVGSRNRTAGYRDGTDTAALVFAYEVADADEDTIGVSIEAGRIALNGGTIEDEAENAAELAHEVLGTQAGHQVDGVRPAFVSAAVDGSSLTLTYGEALDGGSRPASGDFTVAVDGAGRSVTGVSISGSVVTLTLNPAVEHVDTGIRVSYTPDTNPIRDAVGNDAQGLSNRSVTNTTGAPNTDPEITSPSSFDVPENQLVARRLVARDSDPGDAVTGWDIVGGADQGQFAITSDTGELSFRDPPDFEAPGDNEYVVTVEVTSGAGARELEAEQTFTISVTDEREPPDVPEAPAFSGETADSLTVSWTEPDNTGPAITDYDVQYREKGAGRFTDGGHEGSGLAFTLSDLEAGTDYEVQVRASNDEGTSDWSESGEGMTVTPLTVQMTTNLPPPVEGAFTMRFSFSETVRGFTSSDIETQQQPACTDSGNNPVSCNPSFAALQTTDDRIFTTTVTPRTEQVAHNYTLTITVRASGVISVVGNKPNEAAALDVRTAPPGVTVPISSIGLRANSGNGQVTLRWNTPANSGGAAIVRYEYRFAATGEDFSAWENVPAGTRGVTVGGLINGREYVFEVRGVNALGKGGAETVQATPERRIAPPPPPPPPPGNGGGGGGLLFPPEAPLGLMAMPGEGAVRLEWSPPESDGGTPILRYEYRLKEGRGEFGEWTRIEDSAPGEVNATGYTVGELGNGTVYVFELRAVNLVGKGRVSEAVEAVMELDRAYWSNFLAGDLQGIEASLERGPFGGGPQSLRLRFGADLRFEESELDGEGEVTETRSGSYGYRYTSRTTGELRLDYDGGKTCELRLTFRGVGAGSYSFRCGGVLGGQGSFRMSGLNRAPEITSAGAYEVAENTARVGRIEAVDGDDEIGGYGIAGGADGGLFAVVAETGELRFREAPDYEDPSDVESAEPASGAADNEYIVVVEVRSGEGERERKESRAIRVRVADEEELPEITSLGPFEVVENRTRVGQLEAVDQDKQDEITEYGIAGGADGELFAVEAGSCCSGRRRTTRILQMWRARNRQAERETTNTL